jgi:hypothetical protein
MTTDEDQGEDNHIYPGTFENKKGDVDVSLCKIFPGRTDAGTGPLPYYDYED